MELPAFTSRTNNGILAMLGKDVVRFHGPAWGGDELLNVVPEPLGEQARSDVGLIAGRGDANAEQRPISPLAVVSGAERRYGLPRDLGRQHLRALSGTVASVQQLREPQQFADALGLARDPLVDRPVRVAWRRRHWRHPDNRHQLIVDGPNRVGVQALGIRLDTSRHALRSTQEDRCQGTANRPPPTSRR